MLQVTIEPVEIWDSNKEEFAWTPKYTFTIEHSLVSVSKWESIWNKPFLSDDNKSRKEFLSYIKCMTITQNIPNNAYNLISSKEIKRIKEYINSPMTATWFREDKNKKNNGRQVVTSEVIYYWMVAAQIPFTPTEKWHLNRLLTLIRVCNEKNNPEKQSKKDIYKQNSELNAIRRAKMHSKG